MKITTSKNTKRATALIGSTLAIVSLSGCNNAGEGLFSGAALGATTGLILGSMDGNAGKGAAIGAIAGGLGGAIIGDQNDRNANQRNNYNSHRHVRETRHHNDPWWESDQWCD
ncbi:MAG: hypothetical protein KC996_08760 [Phycisphaerales bacterium]|nr:hypothetical protein [Phycisphaerales bacterium]